MAALGWMSVIWWTSSFSPPATEVHHNWRNVLQNFLHAPAYGFLALLLIMLLPRKARWPELNLLECGLVLFGTLSYGVIDELHQSRVPNRDLSVFDLITDGTAAICVLLIVKYLGQERATESGLARRFSLGLLACLVCALMATFVPKFFPEIAWF